MDLYTFNSVINSVSIQEKTVTGVVSDSGTLPGVNVVVRGTRAVLKQILMENTLLKQETGDVLVFSFVGMAE
jgi:hypothetical protein